VDEFTDAAQSGTPEVDGEGGGREQLAAPLPFLPAKLGCLSSSYPFRNVWEQGGVLVITPMSSWQGRGSFPCPQAVGGPGREQDPRQCHGANEGGAFT